MLQKTVGIVLRTLKYKDNSWIAELYTEASGRVSYLVPVSRSRKSAVRTTLFQPLALVEVVAEVRPHTTIYKVHEAKLVYPFISIPYDPYKSAIALFLSEFLYRAVRSELEDAALFQFLRYSILWLDQCKAPFANFHLTFLIRLSRFLGFYPNVDHYSTGDFFDLRNAYFTSQRPLIHSDYLEPIEAARLNTLMRMRYETMHLFAFNRVQRARCLAVLNRYYQLHIPDFPELKSLQVLQELFS